MIARSAMAAADCPSSFSASALIRYISARRKKGKSFGCDWPVGASASGGDFLERTPPASFAEVASAEGAVKMGGFPGRSFQGRRFWKIVPSPETHIHRHPLARW